MRGLAVCLCALGALPIAAFAQASQQDASLAAGYALCIETMEKRDIAPFEAWTDMGNYQWTDGNMIAGLGEVSGPIGNLLNCQVADGKAEDGPVEAMALVLAGLAEGALLEPMVAGDLFDIERGAIITAAPAGSYAVRCAPEHAYFLEASGPYLTITTLPDRPAACN